MKQTNIIELAAYRDQYNLTDSSRCEAYPEDLVTAIQKLIRRLRDRKPIEQVTLPRCHSKQTTF